MLLPILVAVRFSSALITMALSEAWMMYSTCVKLLAYTSVTVWTHCLLEAMNFVKSSTRKGWEKLPDGRKNKPEYAERAVLEALVNHFIHRDYTVMGGEVHLDIYDDRLVITSPRRNVQRTKGARP